MKNKKYKFTYNDWLNNSKSNNIFGSGQNAIIQTEHDVITDASFELNENIDGVKLPVNSNSYKILVQKGLMSKVDYEAIVRDQKFTYEYVLKESLKFSKLMFVKHYFNSERKEDLLRLEIDGRFKVIEKHPDNKSKVLKGEKYYYIILGKDFLDTKKELTFQTKRLNDYHFVDFQYQYLEWLEKFQKERVYNEHGLIRDFLTSLGGEQLKFACHINPELEKYLSRKKPEHYWFSFKYWEDKNQASAYDIILNHKINQIYSDDSELVIIPDNIDLARLLIELLYSDGGSGGNREPDPLFDQEECLNYQYLYCPAKYRTQFLVLLEKRWRAIVDSRGLKGKLNEYIGNKIEQWLLEKKQKTIEEAKIPTSDTINSTPQKRGRPKESLTLIQFFKQRQDRVDKFLKFLEDYDYLNDGKATLLMKAKEVKKIIYVLEEKRVCKLNIRGVELHRMLKENFNITFDERNLRVSSFPPLSNDEDADGYFSSLLSNLD